MNSDSQSSIHLCGNGVLMDPAFLRGMLAHPNAARSDRFDASALLASLGLFFGALLLGICANLR